jgi:hypothetical protein
VLTDADEDESAMQAFLVLMQNTADRALASNCFTAVARVALAPMSCLARDPPDVARTPAA